ncbi:transcription initiation factor IIA subunit 2 [Drosophila eugracilis]|uniref:transcription initiation factor IIA subunit 2 n=1 Tax=Drosophila eugracilis TaxID=29029 RepID=UPI0007E61AFC|nr:transcription initiation factor IIA subunit 2 [Drosophila eugracilis]
MNSELYRHTTLGNALEDTLEEMIQEGIVSDDLVRAIWKKYDKSITKALQKRAAAKLTFKADKLVNYRFCDNVWTLILEGVEFRDGPHTYEVDKVKVVAVLEKNKWH